MRFPNEPDEKATAALDEFVAQVLNELDSKVKWQSEPSLFDEINTYEAIYQRARRVLPHQHSELIYYKNKYIAILMDYGYEFKGIWNAGGEPAKDTFLKALRVEPGLPLAHYRLGHIYYKQGSYDQAVEHFQKALRLRAWNPLYELKPFQLDHAREVLSFCYINLFEKEVVHLPVTSNYPELQPTIRRYTDGLSLDKICGVSRVLRNGQLSEAKPITIDEHRALREQVEQDRGLACMDMITLQPVFAYGLRELDLTHQRTIMNMLLFLFGQREDPQVNTHDDSARKQLQRLRDAFRINLGLEPPVLEFTREPGGTLRMRTDLEVHLFTYIGQ